MSRNILVVSPHPDDEAIGCGGTILRLVEEGCAVHLIFLTSGEAGGHGADADATARIREAEAGAAAAVLGCRAPEFWRARDGALESADTIVERLRAWIAVERPAVIYTTHGDELHPDHRAAARIVGDAVAAIDPAERPIVLLFEVWTPLASVDQISDIGAVLDRKVAAIRCYASQLEHVAFDEAIVGLNRYRGELLCWPEGDYAEVFRRLRV